MREYYQGRGKEVCVCVCGQGSEWNFCRREIEVHDKRRDMDGWMTDKEREVESSQESPE